VAGNFTDFAGQGGLLILDGATGAPLKKQWKVGRPVFALTVWPGDGQTVFAAAGGPGGRLYALDPDKPTKPKWQAAVDGDAVGVAASKTHAFLLGHYDYIVPGVDLLPVLPERHGPASPRGLRRGHGALDAWNPRANTSTGPWGAAVTGDRLLVVGEFTTINGQRRLGYAQFAMK
jgi:hypothetical protein